MESSRYHNPFTAGAFRRGFSDEYVVRFRPRLEPGQAISLLDLHRDLSGSLPGRTTDDLRALVAGLERDGLVAHHGEAIALRD